MTFNTAAKVPGVRAGGIIPPAPPTQFQRSNTLFVSQTGDDATAAREDGFYVYETIEAAIADALAGDTVIVSPGDYVAAGVITIPANVNLHFINGATLTAAASSSLFPITNDGATITGDGEFIINAVYGFDNTGIDVLAENIFVECKKITVNGDGGIGVWLRNGSSIVTVKENIEVNGDSLGAVINAGDHVVTVSEVKDAGTDRIAVCPLVQTQGTDAPIRLVFNAQKITNTSNIDAVTLIVTTDDDIVINCPLIVNNYMGSGDPAITYFEDGVTPRVGDCIRYDLDGPNPTRGRLVVNGALRSVQGVGIYRYFPFATQRSSASVTAVFNCDINATKGITWSDANSYSMAYINGNCIQNYKSYLGSTTAASSQSHYLAFTGKIVSRSENFIDIAAQGPLLPVLALDCIASVGAAESVGANAGVNVIIYNFFSNVAMNANVTELVSNSIIDPNVT